MNTNPNQQLIDKINELADFAQNMEPHDQSVSMIVGGLHTARDFAIRHGEEKGRASVPASPTPPSGAASTLKN